MNEEWAKAFVAAQGDLPEITKDKTVSVQTRNGGSFQYSYADLPSIVAKIRPVLAKNGLAVAQDVEIQEGRVVVTTRIYHTSGHMETFGPVVLNGGNDAQAAGSAITYARRYALCAALNIAADEDDDGQVAKNSAGPTASQPRSAISPADAPPKNAGGGADGADNSPNKAAASPAPSPTQSQSQEGGTENKEQVGSKPIDSVPPVSGDWTSVLEEYGAAGVLQIAQEVAKELELKAPFTKRALAEMPDEVFQKVTERLGEKERVA